MDIASIFAALQITKKQLGNIPAAIKRANAAADAARNATPASATVFDRVEASFSHAEIRGLETRIARLEAQLAELKEGGKS